MTAASIVFGVVAAMASAAAAFTPPLAPRVPRGAAPRGAACPALTTPATSFPVSAPTRERSALSVTTRALSVLERILKAFILGAQRSIAQPAV